MLEKQKRELQTYKFEVKIYFTQYTHNKIDYQIKTVGLLNDFFQLESIK